jgi:RNA polymerase sigma factor (sigma-70 family)
MIANCESLNKSADKKKFPDNPPYGYVLKDFTNGRKFYSFCKVFSLRHGIQLNDFEDIYQEVIVKSELSELNGRYLKEKADEWIYFFKIFKHTLIDFLRKDSKDRLVNQTDLSRDEERIAELFEKNKAYHNKTPLNILIHRESPEIAQEIVSSAIRRLPNKDANIIFQTLMGHSYKKIAETNKLVIGTVKSRLYNAKEKLKQRIIHTKGFNIEDVLF